MKILEVLDSFYPNVDGPVNVIVNIAKTLKDKNLAEVELLVPDFPKQRKEIDGIKIHRCVSMKAPEGYRAGLPFLNSKVKKLIENGNFDIVHVHSPFTIGKYVIKKAKKYKIPTLMTVHTQYKSDFERTLKLKSLQKFMLNYIMKGVNNADYVLSVSNQAGEVVKSYGYKGDKVHIIRNGTDLKPVKLSEETLKEIKKEYGLENHFVFLFVGRIVENNNFKFLIVGGGDYSAKLKDLAKEYNLEENVIFAGKIYDREKLSAIYQSADLFLFPSVFDTCGIVAIEGAANSLPSVMIENSCASEVVTNGENGLALPANSEVWKDEIIKVMQDKDLLNKMKERALQDIYVHWEDIVLQYYDFYKKVLEEKK